jgi:hypothetical protein
VFDVGRQLAQLFSLCQCAALPALSQGVACVEDESEPSPQIMLFTVAQATAISSMSQPTHRTLQCVRRTLPTP